MDGWSFFPYILLTPILIISVNAFRNCHTMLRLITTGRLQHSLKKITSTPVKGGFLQVGLCACVQGAELLKGTNGKQWIFPGVIFYLRGNTIVLCSESFDDRLVAEFQMMGWSLLNGSLRYSSSDAQLVTLLPPGLLLPTCPLPSSAILPPPQTQLRRPWLPTTSGLHSCFAQHLLKWTGSPINRTKWVLKMKTLWTLSSGLPLLSLHGLVHTHTQTA